VSGPRLVVTTCGTSLLTNTASQEDRPRLVRIANARELAREDRAFLDTCVGRARARLFSPTADVRSLSAELNGLLTFFRGKIPRADLHLLVTTDTAAGRAAAGLLQEWLCERLDMKPQVLDPSDLALRSSRELRWGLAQLARELEDWLAGYSGRLFNLSGGFKSINGFLQALAMLWDAEIFYVFEGGGDAITIPRLPVRLDLERLERHAALLRSMAFGGAVEAARLRGAGIPESLWVEDEGQATLSEWGQLLWGRVADELYKKTLLDPPPPMRLEPGLKEKLERQFREHLGTINRRIDQLARYLRQSRRGEGANVQGLDFKPLQGNPRPPATHEFDITHSHGALRGFGYFAGDGDFVICDLDLHD